MSRLDTRSPLCETPRRPVANMKICYLANASNVHTTKWANHFSRKGHEVTILSFEPGIGLDPRVRVCLLGSALPLRMQYIVSGRSVRRLLREAQPDILHAHYASGYGTLGRLAEYRPYILSVWGSDVFEFPKASPLHRALLKSNLASAGTICSTSHCMAAETRRHCARPILVTPFGVDCEQFCPSNLSRPRDEEFVIGTVKMLEPKYGVEYLIRSFELLASEYKGSKRLRLEIAGDGSLRRRLEKLVRTLGITGQVSFLGMVPHEKVAEVLNRFSVFAALSVDDSESFGVAIIEASACEIPVVVTNVGGLPEVMRHRVTGLMVPARDVTAAANAFQHLLENESLRRELGKAGRRFVLENFEWSENASRMERVYESILEEKTGSVQLLPEVKGAFS